MVRREGLSRPDHLRFLGVAAKTRRSYEQAVQQSRHFSFIFAPYGAGCQSLWLNLMRNGVSISTTSTRRGTMSPLRAGPSAASNGFCRGASRTFKPPSCSFGTGTGSTSHRGTSPLRWLGAKAMAAAAAQTGRFDLALLIFIGFAFFLRTMELPHLRRSHIRIFPQDGTVVIAILNAKSAKGLQQSLSLQEDGLVAVLQYLMDRGITCILRRCRLFGTSSPVW